MITDPAPAICETDGKPCNRTGGVRRHYRRGDQACPPCLAAHAAANREAARLWREANREKARERDRRWREANREKARERVRRWREANREKTREAARRWREANREKTRERERRWSEANREKTREKTRDRRARLGGDKPRRFAAEIAARDGWQCRYCGTPLLGAAFHVDHIHPLSRADTYERGPENINELANLALACPPCNMSKHDSLYPAEWQPNALQDAHGNGRP